jgi:SAM-dependent methyltransferase
MLDALHVGCGHARLPEPLFPAADWREIRLDIDPSTQPDIVASLTELPVGDGAVSAVFSSHNMEHLAPHDVPRALAEFFRVLRPGGFCLVAVPDIQQAAARIADGRGDDVAYVAPCGPITAMDVIFGHAGMRADNPWMAHRTGFTLASLRAAMIAAGFRVQRSEVREWDLIVLGVRDGDSP